MMDFNETGALAGSANDYCILRDVLRFTLEDFPGLLADIDTALERENWPEVSRLSHKARGFAGACGAPRLSRMALELELSAKGGDANCVRFRHTLQAAFEAFRIHPRVIELSTLDVEKDVSLG